MTSAAAAFTVVFIALYAAHQVGDHWVQTGREAGRKGLPGWPGRLACAEHAATLTVTKLAAIAAAVLVLGVHVAPWALAGALTLDAISHYWADRRTTLAGLRAGQKRLLRDGRTAAGSRRQPVTGDRRLRA